MVSYDSSLERLRHLASLQGLEPGLPVIPKSAEHRLPEDEVLSSN